MADTFANGSPSAAEALVKNQMNNASTPGAQSSPVRGSPLPPPPGEIIINTPGATNIATLSVPPDADLLVECWGGGGTGENGAATGAGGGMGGGGGGYAGAVVGAGLWAVGGTLTVGAEGSPTKLTISAVDRVFGDEGATGTAGGAGGVGTVGAGVIPVATATGTPGSAAVGNAGGAGGAGGGVGTGGAGGAGGASGLSGQAGLKPGGGGGGGGDGFGEGGFGGEGRARVSWPAPA